MRKLVSTLVVQMGDFQKKIAPSAPDKGMDAQDVCDGLMPKHFLKGLQQHPLEYGQNGKCVACKIRDDLDPAVAFPVYDSKAEPHGIVFTYRKGTFRRVFLFIRTPIFFNQFDSNRQ